MKLFLDNVDLSSTSGPNQFAKLLISSLLKKNHKLTNFQDSEVVLSFIQCNDEIIKSNKPVVLRLDGIWLKKNQQEQNIQIKKSYDRADFVIVQSEFDSELITKRFGRKQHHIIRNGTNTELPLMMEIPDALYDIRNKFEVVFACSSRWRGYKRLEEITRIFKLISRKINSCLIVMGNPNGVFSGPNIFFAGDISRDDCLKIFSLSDWMFHLAWLDHCPNSVLDSLSMKTPIICTNSGGTHEILRGKRDVNSLGIGKNGIVIDDIDYDYSILEEEFAPQIPEKSVNYLLNNLEILKKSNDVELDTSTYNIISCVENYEKILLSASCLVKT